MLLFALDRWLLKPKIDLWLSQGKALVSSRSIFCSLAYQGAQGISWDDILRANNWGSLRLPDVMLILDIDPDIAYSRCSRTERFEEPGFLGKVRQQYLIMVQRAHLFPTRIHLIDASGSVEEVFARVLAALDRTT